MRETFHSVEMIEVERIKPNDYNPNVMSAKTYGSLIENIKSRGFKSAVYVLPVDESGVYTLVDGEHRWKAAKEAGLLKIPCVVLPASREEAMMDTVTMNQLRGAMIPVKLALVIAELSKRVPVPVLEKELGFEEHELADQLELLNLPDDIAETIEKQAAKDEEEALQVMTFIVRRAHAELIEKVIEHVEKGMDGANKKGRALHEIVRFFEAQAGEKSAWVPQ